MDGGDIVWQVEMQGDVLVTQAVANLGNGLVDNGVEVHCHNSSLAVTRAVDDAIDVIEEFGHAFGGLL